MEGRAPRAFLLSVAAWHVR